VPVQDIRRFEKELHEYVKREHAGLLTGIVETGKLDDDTVVALTDAVAAFKQTFTKFDGEPLIQDVAPAGLTKEDVGQEKITRHVAKSE
jgi:F-type H+/Na+-transporting ATPase subunit alpha